MIPEASPTSWSTTDSVHYEVAIEALSQLVGACTAGIVEEQGRAAPDESVLAEYRAQSASFSERQLTLNPDDAFTVNQVIQEYQLLRARLGRR